MKTKEELEKTEIRRAVRAFRELDYDVHFKDVVKVPHPRHEIYIAMCENVILLYSPRIGGTAQVTRKYYLFD